jgi:hypothetical protein
MAAPLHHFLAAFKFCQCSIEGLKGKGVQGLTYAKKDIIA